MSENGKVYLVDDDPAVQRGVAALLRAADFDVELFSSGDAFLSALPELALEGAVLLVDVRMPGIQGTQLQAKLAADKTPLPVVIMTAHGDIPMAVQAMQNGASGFLEKPFTADQVVAALHRARDMAVNEFAASGDAAPAARLDRLTPREREVVRELVKGATSKEIARALNLSPRTVEAHRRNIMAKLKAGSIAELVRMAMGARPGG